MLQQDILILPTDRGLRLIQTVQIIRIQALSNYSRLYFNDGRSLVVAKVLGWFEEKLAEHDFIRIHRTHLVNTRFISEYSYAGKAGLMLRNGERIAVSRRKKCNIKKAMVNMAA